MPRIINPKRAYAIASQWGSYLSVGDVGACFYGFHFDDGRPVSEAHRKACESYTARLLLNPDLGPRGRAELRSLARFFRHTTIRA